MPYLLASGPSISSWEGCGSGRWIGRYPEVPMRWTRSSLLAIALLVACSDGSSLPTDAAEDERILEPGALPPEEIRTRAR